MVRGFGGSGSQQSYNIAIAFRRSDGMTTANPANGSGGNGGTSTFPIPDPCLGGGPVSMLPSWILGALSSFIQ